ncbi:MAG: neutral zinc metallopeptidase [Akkermansiaceae bacterium]
MKWKGRQSSGNVEDARGRGPVQAGGGHRGMGLGLLAVIGRKFGIKGILVAVIAGILLWKLGIVDPSRLFGESPAMVSSVEISPEDTMAGL